MVKAEALDPHTVRYSFKGELVRDLPLTVADAADLLQGLLRDARRSTRRRSIRRSAQAPIWSTAWRRGAPSSIARNPNYWAKDLPVNRGRCNFDKIRFEYFRDRTAGMEAFKAGTYDFREEFTSKVWATEYDFPAIRAGKVKKECCPTRRRQARKASSSIRGASR